MELIKVSADQQLKAGLEQDIGELDWLVDEIPPASRLDARVLRRLLRNLLENARHHAESLPIE
jgi:hypothetical protein